MTWPLTPALRRAAFLAGAALALTATAAYAQVERRFDIPRQSAAEALNDFTRQSGQRLLFPYDAVAGKVTRPVRGDLTTDEALARLLADAGLVVGSRSRGVLILRARPPAEIATPPAVRLEPVELSEVVVTVQKRDERLLDVPLQVRVVSAEALTRQNITQLAELYTRVPGLQYSSGRITGLSIRGINAGGVANPTVALLVDDVPFGSSTGAGQPPIPDFDPATLDHIEVLRGPQGTIYGASSLGGLIKYVTRAPRVDRLEGRLELGAQSVAHGGLGYAARGSLNLPVARDRAAVLLSGFVRDDPRWLDNIHPTARGRDVNSKKTWGARAAVLLQPADGLDITLTAMKQTFRHRYNDLADSNTTQVCVACRTADGAGRVTTFDPIYPAGAGDIRTLNVAFSDGRSEFELYTGRVEYDMKWARLTSITALGKSFNVVNNDTTAVFGALLLPPRPNAPGNGVSVGIANANRTRKYSQELRLGSPSGGRVEWLGGVFLTGEESEVPQVLTVYDAAGQPVTSPYVGGGPNKYREQAGFGYVTYHFDTRASLQVGARYAANKQSSVQDLQLTSLGAAAFGPEVLRVARSDEAAFTWLVTPTWRLSPDAMLYARIASGYRPGGPNTGSANLQPTFASDSVINYELGYKGYLIPGLSLDAAVFQIDWKDIQLSNTDAVSQLTFLSNGGKARSRGVEAALTWRTTGGLTLNSHAAWTDAVLTADLPIGVNTLMGRKGDSLPFTPKWSAAFTVQQDFRLDDRLNGFVAATWAYVGDRPTLFKTNAALATRPRYTIPAYSIVDLSAGLTLDRDWDLGLFVRNLLDGDGIVTSGNRNGTNNPTARFIQPRTLGVSLARRF